MITGMPRVAIAVNDIDFAIETFRGVCEMPILDVSADTVPRLGVRIVMCVPVPGSNIELMSPADPATPLSRSLQKFLGRRGEGLFALMLEAPDPDSEASELARRGLTVLPLMPGAEGRDIHPASTCGVLIRVYPVHSFCPETYGFAAPVTEGLVSGIVRVIVAVNDLPSSVGIYRDGLGLTVTDEFVDDELGTQTVRLSAPTGGSIDLASPLTGTLGASGRVASFLSQRGEGMFALVHESKDLLAMRRALRRVGIDVESPNDSAPESPVYVSVLGSLLRLEQCKR